MRASESAFEGYTSRRILYFGNLICSEIYGPKALKIPIFDCTEKLRNIFETGLKKKLSDRAEMPPNEKGLRNKKFPTLR